uniref:Uncharacterized protein n=1 Tax=Anguilla anguilla TaxID=7936 RepID=A0A0E9WWW3_ANGAN
MDLTVKLTMCFGRMCHLCRSLYVCFWNVKHPKAQTTQQRSVVKKDRIKGIFPPKFYYFKHFAIMLNKSSW